MTVDTTATTNKSTNPNASPSTSNQTPSSSSSSHNASMSASSPPSSNPNIIKKNRSDVIKTIQEITKFDEYVINQAIEACQDNEGRYSMDQVLNILMDEKYSSEQNQDKSQSNRYNRQNASDPSSADRSDKFDEGNGKYLSRSSNSNQTGASNDRTNDFSNVYGASNNLDDDDDYDYDLLCNNPTSPLASNGSGSAAASVGLSSSQRVTGYVGTATSSLSESNILREDGKPSGLKNVGNTCWFNSIIQTFFHLPYFRRLILSFHIDPSEIVKLDENSKNVVQFVIELRKLFALMLKSKRKAINPNQTLRCLRSCSKYDVDTFNQEDVSEFATILVNLIEESFDILSKLQQQATSATTSITAGASLNDSNNAIKNSVSPNDSNNSFNISDLVIENLNNLNIKAPSEKQQAAATAAVNQLNNLRKNRKNPIVNLLNGDMLINRKNSDEDVTNTLMEIFREVNIQMCNSRSLHEGLELEWGETSIDKSSSSTTTPNATSNINQPISFKSANSEDVNKMNKSFYEQESWIVKLPSALFICLNRYKFVKATQSSSKILEPFEFYPYIYLDRYIYANREIVKNKRKELKQLNSELKVLEEKLNSIKMYKFDNSINQNGNVYSLDEVMRCALHFATTDYSLNDVFNQMKPLTRSSTDQTETIVKEEKEQLTIVTSCLKSWIGQIETKINELKLSINQLKNKINTIYDEENLKKVRYNLHSVCIHEGNASSGHFWTYIWNTQQLKWFKFNDTEVSESNWDDLYANAVGGNLQNENDSIKENNKDVLRSLKADGSASTATAKIQAVPTTPTTTAKENENLNDFSKNFNLNINSGKTISNDRSAYFLVYTSADDSNLYLENHELDQDLIKFLNEDQETLENQLNSLRLKQILRENIENLKKSNSALAALNLNTNSNSDSNNQTCIEHAKAFADSTMDAFTAGFDRIIPVKSASGSSICNGAEEALKLAVENELNKYNESVNNIISKLPANDLRLNHILTYFNANSLTRELKILALYDIFRMQIFPENHVKLKIIQTLAQIKYNEYLLTSAAQSSSSATASSPSGSTLTIQQTSVMKIYEKWQADFRDFRSIIAAFINAVTFLETQRFEEAAPFFCVACEYNERITANLTNKMKGMDHEFLLASRRKCLKMWNQSAIRKFVNRNGNIQNAENLTNLLNTGHNLNVQNQPLSQQELTSLIEGMINKFLPCLFRLAASTDEDKAMFEEIRKDWLNVLDSNLPEIQIFHDFMTKLFEETYANHYHSLNVNKTNLPSRYKEVVQSIQRIRY